MLLFATEDKTIGEDANQEIRNTWDVLPGPRFLGEFPDGGHYSFSFACYLGLGIGNRDGCGQGTRFADGSPLTADDVVATWKLNIDKTIQDPLRNTLYGKYEEPVAESKYIVRVKAKEPGWTGLYYFSGLPIYSARSIKGLTGTDYVRTYNDKMLPGTGPYSVGPMDLDKGNSVHIRRRKDYWADAYRRNVGSNNFDEIRNVVVRDRNLEFEMVKRGDLDFYFVNRAQMWVQELNFDKIQSGVLQKRKVWNHSPNSIQGIAFNTRRPPYDDLRVRKALRLLFNRELMVEKLTFNAATRFWRGRECLKYAQNGKIIKPQFEHKAWQGCSLWDLIQPSFMFMVGVAVPFSCAKRREWL